MNPQVQNLELQGHKLFEELKLLKSKKMDINNQLRLTQNYIHFIQAKQQVIAFQPYSDMKKYEELYRLSDENVKLNEVNEELRNKKFEYDEIKDQIAYLTEKE